MMVDVSTSCNLLLSYPVPLCVLRMPLHDVPYFLTSRSAPVGSCIMSFSIYSRHPSLCVATMQQATVPLVTFSHPGYAFVGPHFSTSTLQVHSLLTLMWSGTSTSGSGERASGLSLGLTPSPALASKSYGALSCVPLLVFRQPVSRARCHRTFRSQNHELSCCWQDTCTTLRTGESTPANSFGHCLRAASETTVTYS